MEIKLWKKPKNCSIIEGFPGFGLVGTIASEFLLDHLEVEQIGKILIEDSTPMVAIHESKIIEPLGIFYNKKYNLIILHAITPATGMEWKIAEALGKTASELKAKEIISLEGVGSAGSDAVQSRIFYYASTKDGKKMMEKAGLTPLKEGIIMGVTGAILLRVDKVPVSCVFAETHTDIPDSKAAAKIIEALDRILDLKVDAKPLLQQAERFEDKLRGLMMKGKEAQDISEKKRMSYVG